MYRVFEDELRHRVRRIASGDHRADDPDRIFLSLRDRSQDRDSVREAGDFIAHRAQREKGLLTRQARDVFLSFQTWMHIRSGGGFTVADIRKVAEANLRIVNAPYRRRMLVTARLLKLDSVKPASRLLAIAEVEVGADELCFVIRGIRLEREPNGVSVRMPVDRNGAAIVSLESQALRDAIAQVVINAGLDAGLVAERLTA